MVFALMRSTSFAVSVMLAGQAQHVMKVGVFISLKSDEVKSKISIKLCGNYK